MPYDHQLEDPRDTPTGARTRTCDTCAGRGFIPPDAPGGEPCACMCHACVTLCENAKGGLKLQMGELPIDLWPDRHWGIYANVNLLQERLERICPGCRHDCSMCGGTGEIEITY